MTHEARNRAAGKRNQLWKLMASCNFFEFVQHRRAISYREYRDSRDTLMHPKFTIVGLYF